ncbi:MAG: DUF444 family protein [Anaeromyxobacteraceae bacterium]|nr:DUF444 family protein [Anaeromyxobacteraceae bacterium]
MPHRIRQDHGRFREIVRGRIKADLGRYVQHDELLARHGKDLVSIPVPAIELPRFRFEDRQLGAVGQGEGAAGAGGPGGAPGDGRGGLGPGQHLLEVDVTLDELADLLGEALALPRLRPRGHERVLVTRPRWRSVAPTGPESSRHFRRTYRRALRRHIASGTYAPGRPVVVPERRDRRYRASRGVPVPETNAVAIYMLDVSGSMGDEQKAIVRTAAFWLDAWLRRHYPGLVTRYLVHDAAAREVDREAFFRTREAGGTVISSVYGLALEIIEADYPPPGWNVYPFHFSDGDNSSDEDTQACLALLRERLLPAVNQLCYGQVRSPYGSAMFLQALRDGLGSREDLACADIPDRAGILPAIQAFLGRGR